MHQPKKSDCELIEGIKFVKTRVSLGLLLHFATLQIFSTSFVERSSSEELFNN